MDEESSSNGSKRRNAEKPKEPSRIQLRQMGSQKEKKDEVEEKSPAKSAKDIKDDSDSSLSPISSDLCNSPVKLRDDSKLNQEKVVPTKKSSSSSLNSSLESIKKVEVPK